MNDVHLLPLYQYVSGFALLFVAFIYVPVLIWLLRKLWRRLPLAHGWRVSLVTGLFLVALILPFADVAYVGLQHQALCRKDAGTHLYKTVEADGFDSGSLLLESMLDRGFSYVEGENPVKLYRAEKHDGKVVYQRIEAPVSRYMYMRDEEILSHVMAKNRRLIKDRQSSEVLAEHVNYGYYRGWLDRRVFLGWMGPIPPITCGLPDIGYDKFILSALIPTGTSASGGANR